MKLRTVTVDTAVGVLQTKSATIVHGSGYYWGRAGKELDTFKIDVEYKWSDLIFFESILSGLQETGFYAFFTVLGGVSVGWPGSEQRGFQHEVFNKADRGLRATLPRLSVSKRGLRANIGCHRDRENPNITFFNLEFFFVWSINAFKSREPADEPQQQFPVVLEGFFALLVHCHLLHYVA